MKLYLIRHGQTDWNVEGRIQGTYDSELNQTGIIQAEELGRKIRESGYGFSKVYTSQQRRALKTAEIICKSANINLIPVEGLQEMNLGVWEGLTWTEVKESYPDEYNEWLNNRRYAKIPKGESYQDVLDRVLKVLHKIIDENNSNVAIVTHGAVIMSLQCFVTNTPFNEMRKFSKGNATITEFDSVLFMSEKIEK